jgi:flagellar biosynthesis protein
MPEQPPPPAGTPPGQPPRRQRWATALSYQPGDNAPKVTASGVGLIADRIVEAARQSGVPIRSDPSLAQALGALDLGAEVPQALYVAVAEALAWAYRLDASKRAA